MPIGHEIFNYDGMYENETEQFWRRIGSIDKVSNIQIVAKDLVDLKNMRMCEIGCGDGSIAEELAKRNLFARYRGYEISSSGIMAAKNRKIPHTDFHLISATAKDNEFENAEIVLLCHVIEHLENPRELLVEVGKIADLLVVEVPLEDNRGLRLDYDWDPVGHINKFNHKTIRQLLQTCDYEILRQFTSNPSREVRTFFDKSLKANLVWIIKEYALRISLGIAKLFFTYHETILARRVHPRVA